MASSKLMMNMSSSTSRNSDLIRRKSSNSSSSNSTSTNHKHPGPPIINNSAVFQMTVDGLLPSLHYNNNHQQPPEDATLLDVAGAVNPIQTTCTVPRQETMHSSSNGVEKSVDDIWKEIVAGRSCKQEEAADEMMTLEDFLAKAGVVEEDVKMPLPLTLESERLSGGIFSFDNQSNMDGNGNGNGTGTGIGVVGFGMDEMGSCRGKRRAILEPLDKAAQQRQKRMIKNRESAARSRERKQAYQAELESLAVKLEQENETLLKAKREQTRKRYKQLIDNVIPVTEKRRPTRYVLRKVRSMEW